MKPVPFDPPAGLFSDDTRLAAKGRWADMSNMRFWEGKAQVIGGWESLTISLASGVCRAVLAWTDQATVANIALGTNTALQILKGGNFSDITPAGLAPGQVDGTGGSGYGTGAYGAGAYSEPSTADTFPRTWSLSPFGETLIANPRREGIYEWNNNPATPATLLANAPAKAVYTLVTASDQIMALGCNEEASGVFKPLCIRHSSIRKKNEWNTNTNTTAREYTLPGGGEIVAGRNMGAYVLVWTTAALYVGTFQASLAQPWRFERVGEKCGLIGPNAAVVSGLTAMWLAPDLQFRSYSLGGQVEVVQCPIREDMAQNFAASQGDKVVASSLERFGEVRFDYPDARDGFENSRYVVFSRIEGAWSRGRMPRSAMVDAGPLADPIGVTPTGNVYWHERGNSNDGAAFAWFIESGELVLSEEASMMVRGVLPDIARQIGGVVLSLFSRLKPQEAHRAFPPVVMAPGDAKADIRASGRYFRVRLSGSAAPTFARLGRMTFDCKASARR